jgi:Bacterial protein of unknown function (DUF882)
MKMTNISQHIGNVTQVGRNITQRILAAVSAARIPSPLLALPLALVTIVFSFALVATIQASFVPVARDEAYGPTTLQDQRNIFERYSDSLLQPAENCREWETVDARVKRVLTDAGKHFGAPVLMLSCYRSVAYNRAIYKRMGRKPTRSQHIFHKAIDAKIAGVSSRQLASYVRTHPVMRDVGGVGTYCGSPGMVHVDVGPHRNWHWACHVPGKTRVAKRLGKRHLAKRPGKMRFAKRYRARA